MKAVLAAGVLTLLLAAAPELATNPALAATAPHACTLSRGETQRFGPTYVSSLHVAGVSCANGKGVVRAFHACRRAHGGIRGTCRGVAGYRCHELRGVSRQEFSAKVTCTAGRRLVVHTYTQFT
jgi:hypothetical protein